MNKLNIRNLRLADFVHDFSETRQRFSDVILQEGDGVAVIPTLAKKITSELAEVKRRWQRRWLLDTLAVTYRMVSLLETWALKLETDRPTGSEMGLPRQGEDPSSQPSLSNTGPKPGSQRAAQSSLRMRSPQHSHSSVPWTEKKVPVCRLGCHTTCFR